MAYYLTQADDALFKVAHSGSITPISLPVETIGVEEPYRAALLDGYVVLVRGGLFDIYLDQHEVIRPLRIAAPALTPTIAEGTLTGSTWADGVYKARITFKIKDAYGRTIQESAMGPAGTSVAFTTATSMSVTNIAVSPSSEVNARGIYITLAGGDIFYPWFDIDDNTRTAFEERYTLTETGTDFLPAPFIGSTPPNFKLIAAWKDRLWAVPRVEQDLLRWTEERQFYNWPVTNEIVVPLKSVDDVGNNGFLPRRDALGIGKLTSLHRIIGDSNDTFKREKIADVGVYSQESVVVVSDTAYFLGFSAGKFGFYEWSDAGVTPISEVQVDTWLNSTTYFNPDSFDNCLGRYNMATDSIEWAIYAAGSTVVDRWVTYTIQSKAWYGPHTTAAFTLSAAGTDTAFSGTLSTFLNRKISVWGGIDGFLYKLDKTTNNDHESAVDFDVDLPHFAAGAPDYNKVWGEMSIHSRVEPAPDELTITPTIGGLDAAADIPLIHDLTQGRERLARLGQGYFAQLNLRHNVLAKTCRLFGIELPYILRGRR